MSQVSFPFRGLRQVFIILSIQGQLSRLSFQAFEVNRFSLDSSDIYDAKTRVSYNAEFVGLYRRGRYHYLSSEVVYVMLIIEVS